MAGAALPIISTVLGVFGKGQQAQQANVRAGQQKAVGVLKAEQYEKKAKKAHAIAQRKAFGEDRKTKLITSRAISLMAASGGAVSDPGSVNIIADINNEGAYRKSMAIYEGEETAKDYETAAKMSLQDAEMDADQSRSEASAYSISAIGSGLSGGASIYEKFNKPSNKQTWFAGE